MLGAVLGLDAVGTCLALASLIFAGPLAGQADLGTALFLSATLISTLMLAGLGGFRGALGIAQDTSIAVIAPAVAIAAGHASRIGRDPLATGLAVIGLCTILTGLCLYLVGRLGLGRFARLMPYPVAVGFLAGSGWLLTYAALSLMAPDARGGLALGAALVSADHLAVTLPSIAFAVTVLAAQRHLGALPALLGSLLLAGAGFYLWLELAGPGMAEARALGWLPDLGGAAGSPLLRRDILAAISWSALQGALPAMGVVMLISLSGVALNTSGAELAMKADIDFERELRVTGLGNIAIGAFGGLVSYLSAGSTIMAHRLGMGGRMLTTGYCGVVLLGVVLARPLVASVPVFLSAGLLLYIGLSMVKDWLIDSRGRLSAQDWAVVAAIVGVTMWQGMLVAVAVGLVIALVIFVVSYARVPILRRSLSRPAPRSNVDRSPEEARVLRDGGDRIGWAPLQGYLFFGTVERLVGEIRARSGRGGGPGWLILDFTLVSGMDSSATAMLEKLAYLAEGVGQRLILCCLAPELRQGIDRWDPGFLTRGTVLCTPSRDQALEWAEDALIAATDTRAIVTQGFRTFLQAYVPDIARRQKLEDLFVPLTLEPGEVLIQQGDGTRDIFVVDSGRLSVFLRTGPDGALRLRSMTAGAVLGEIATYLDLPRQADVVADLPSRVWRLPGGRLEEVERTDPATAMWLHALMARALADKVTRANLQLESFAG